MRKFRGTFVYISIGVSLAAAVAAFFSEEYLTMVWILIACWFAFSSECLLELLQESTDLNDDMLKLLQDYEARSKVGEDTK